MNVDLKHELPVKFYFCRLKIKKKKMQLVVVVIQNTVCHISEWQM